MMKNSEAMAITKAIREWLVIHLPQMRSCSTHTLKAYRDALKLYIDFLEVVKSIDHQTLSAKCFDSVMIEEWIAWLKNNRGCSNSTCNHRLASIRSFLKYIAHRDVRFIEQENKSANIKFMRVAKKEFVEVTQYAMKALFAAPDLSRKIGKRDFALFNLMYNTAARINEVLSLRIRDLHLDEECGRNYIIIWGKGSKVRTVFLLPEVVRVMKLYIKQFHGSSPDENRLLFYSSVGEESHKLTQEAVNKRLKAYVLIARNNCPQIPMNLHCHNLRSARATHWLEQGLNIVMIQKLLGHENINTTMRYLGISIAQKAKAIETLEDEVAKNATKKWKKVKKDSSLSEILGLK